MKKKLFGILIFLIVIILLFINSRSISPSKDIYTEIEIDAPVEDVWKVLADIENYPSWNPYHVRVTGNLEIGKKLVVDIHKPNGEDVTVKPHVLRLVPNQDLTWGGGIRGLFYGEHVFLLEETSAGATKLIHKESFTGFFVQFVPLESIDVGYQLMNSSLKEYMENNHNEVFGYNLSKISEEK